MSESWLDELDGEEFDDLGTESNKRNKGGEERKETESDIGVSK